MWINNQPVDAESGQRTDATSPHDGQVIGTIPAATAGDANRAVESAARAFAEGPWRWMGPRERRKIMLAVAEAIRGRVPEIARMETLESGKPISDTTGEVPFGADCFEYYAGATACLTGETIPVGGGQFLDYTLREPLGVIGVIIPWNFPFAFACDRVAAAIASGNSVVLKPASETSITATILGEILAEAGLPAGVVNVVTGRGSVAGAAMVAHPQVAKIAFTGSLEVGCQIMQEVSRDMRHACMELGGKSPNIIFEDADLDQAARTGTFAAFVNMGQVCSAGSRFLVHGAVYDEFMERFVASAARIKVGNPLDPATHMGPLVSQSQREVVESYIRCGVEEGAVIVHGGKRPDDPALAKGSYLLPTILAEASNEMRVCREEIFGPVVSVMRFGTEEEAVAIANDTEYGLAAGIWTQNIKRAHRLAQRLDAGNVWINTYNLSFLEAPWGGFKKTGGGKAYSPLSLKEFTRVKNVCVDLNPTSIAWPG
jgi:acyl-CoA reductase-like NAD-dependent aldehyde dehydrogenase